MNRYRKIFSVVVIFIVTKGLLAAPAAPHLMTFEQPDGSIFQGFLKGDNTDWIKKQGSDCKNKFSGFYEFGMLGKDSEGLTVEPSGLEWLREESVCEDCRFPYGGSPFRSG